jgi:hypothetical protein
MVCKLHAGADELWLVQLLDAWELRPAPAGLVELADVETDQVLVTKLDQAVVDSYIARLDQHRTGWCAACRDAGARPVFPPTALELDELCSRALVPSGLLEVRE